MEHDEQWNRDYENALKTMGEPISRQETDREAGSTRKEKCIPDYSILRLAWWGAGTIAAILIAGAAMGVI